MMNIVSIIFTLITVFMLINCKNNSNGDSDANSDHNVLSGTWIRLSQSGVMALNLFENGQFEVDRGRDGSIDYHGTFSRNRDTLLFTDTGKNACPYTGRYKLYKGNNYIAFDLIDDMCGGRIKTTMGFWVRPDFKRRLKKLDIEIEKNHDWHLVLERARMNMALGKSMVAKKDFKALINGEQADDRIYINYAGTCFPDDLEIAIKACTKALELNPEAKNAYFLRGLAKYMSGQEEEGCDDFGTAITLGFSVLKIAEHERCASYWK